MAENSQLSGNMKNSSTGTSSTDASSETIGKHENEIVPHKISNHDKLVQTMVMVDGEWVNVNDTNDQANMKDDMNKVNKKVVEAQKGIIEAKSAADSAAKAADSAVSASVVNSDAITAQSAAISEAKSAISSATAAIQQTAATAASDAAKIRADVAQVQNEVNAAKAANSASVEALKSDVSAAKQDLADVHDRLDQAQSAIEQSQKFINDSVAKITSDVSSTKQDLATVHDSLTKVQAAAEQNQKAIDDSIAKINANVDVTNQDLAGVRKDLTKAQSDIAANQKSINDNVAQINADITQDRKDIASAQQANANTAKQLDTYSKQATEQSKTIKTIQDKQDSFTATLADVQGNVSQVSDKVDGLSASLKDTQGNVATVKAQADQLNATLTDHAKSIATLTASAKELSSTLEDADGRLSKVEQTAQTNSSTLSDVQGDLSQVKQNATKLVSTLKDAQGNISTLQQKADSLSTQLASAQGDIATLQTGIDGVKAILTSHDKSIHTLQADSKSLKDSMVNAQGDISTLRKTATDVTSELEDHTGRLSKVEQSAAKQATTLSDLQGNLSQVEQKADSNTATISSINKNAMQDRGVITDTKTSFDSLTQLGTYSIKASGLPKMPEQHYGTLVVSGSAGSGWLSQQFVADTTGNVYTRVFSNNAWSAWKQGGSQDAINQVKQTADSNSATIRNVQGDVSTLKQTATGIKSTLASHEGDIHTLQADSKSLKDSMTNAQGDISTLQKSATSLDSEMKDHAGRLSKVEQSAATQATTLSNLQGNLTQVKQQADGLVTTLKNAQGSITQIQQKADGTLAQLKSAQGDIASLQTDVTGIKATLTDHEGDIHTLQSDSKTLKDDMQDAQGNISSLQKSSTKLDSEMSSQDGRLSKVEQTASTLTNEFSDEQGHLNRVEQTANGTQQTVANQQGQINMIKTDASGIHETLTGQGNQIANINVTLSGLNTKYEGVSGDLGKLKNSAMQNRGTVSAPDFNSLTAAGFYTITVPSVGKNYPIGNWGTLEVSGQTVDGNGRLNQKYVGDNDGGTYTRQYNADTKSWTAWIKTANQNDINTLSGKITKNSTAIDQTNKQISLKADQTEVDQVKQTASQNSSRLDVMANEIQSKVTSTDVNNIVDSKGYATTGTVQSLVDQKAGTINESITNLTTELKNNNGGGVNLLKGTKDFRPDSIWFPLGAWVRTNDTYNDLTIFKGKPDWDGLTQYYSVKAGETYTFSLNARYESGSGSSKLFTMLNTDPENGHKAANVFPSSCGITLNENWQRYSITFTVKSDGYIKPRIERTSNNKNVLEICGFKLERGSVATPWTPAPSDNATVTQVQSLTASIDGLQSTVKDKADKSQITQLSNLVQSKVSTSDFTSKVSQLSNDINARVTKGSLLSQINIAAGNTLIQSNKIYFDADSFVMSPNSKAFIPSAFITNLSADKITTGTLDASKLHVKNFSADNISGGTLKGIDIQTSDSKSNFEITGPWIQWKSIDKNKMSGEPYRLVNIGSGSTYLIVANEKVQNLLNKSDNMAFSIVSNHSLILSSGIANGEDYSDPTKIIAPDYYPKLTLVGWDVDDQDATGAYLDAGTTNLELHGQYGLVDTTWNNGNGGFGFQVKTWNHAEFNIQHHNNGAHDGDYYKDAQFSIQKDYKLTAAFGTGKKGDQINFTPLGGMNVNGNFHVTGSKNSIVKTTQGYLAINAYETAEYYFGDIGESNTGASGKVIVGIDKIFNETVNTDIQYQVFLTSYGNARLWVSKRYNNRFVVESDTPNAEFGWELKAKRKGYEGNRLRVVHGDFDNPELLKGSTN